MTMTLKLLAVVLLQVRVATAQTQCERESCEHEGFFMQVRATSDSAESAESSMVSHLAFLAKPRESAHSPASVQQLKETVRGMARRAVQAPSGTNYTKFNSSELGVVYQTIIDQMEVVINGTLDSKDKDEKELEVLKNDVANCNAALSTEVSQGRPDSVTAFSPSVQVSSQTHDVCREEQVDTLARLTDANNTYETHMKTPYLNADLQGCMGGFVSNCAGQSVAPYSQRGNYNDAITCAATINAWAGPFHTEATSLQANYTAALETHTKKTEECNGKQKAYEGAFCTYHTELLDACGTLDHCYDASVGTFNKILDLMKQSNTSRYVAFLAARQVQCFVNILMTNNLNFKALDDCDHKAVDTSSLIMTIPTLPGKSECDTSFVDPHPCDQKWIDDNYGNTSWFKKGITPAPCQSCPAANLTDAATATAPPASPASPA